MKGPPNKFARNREMMREYEAGGVTYAALGRKHGISGNMAKICIRREQWRRKWFMDNPPMIGAQNFERFKFGPSTFTLNDDVVKLYEHLPTRVQKRWFSLVDAFPRPRVVCNGDLGFKTIADMLNADGRFVEPGYGIGPSTRKEITRALLALNWDELFDPEAWPLTRGFSNYRKPVPASVREAILAERAACAATCRGLTTAVGSPAQYWANECARAIERRDTP